MYLFEEKVDGFEVNWTQSLLKLTLKQPEHANLVVPEVTETVEWLTSWTAPLWQTSSSSTCTILFTLG